MAIQLHGRLYWDGVKVDAEEEITIELKDNEALDRMQLYEIQCAIKESLQPLLDNVGPSALRVFVNNDDAGDIKTAIRKEQQAKMISLKTSARDMNTPFVVVAPMKGNSIDSIN